MILSTVVDNYPLLMVITQSNSIPFLSEHKNKLVKSVYLWNGASNQKSKSQVFKGFWTRGLRRLFLLGEGGGNSSTVQYVNYNNVMIKHSFVIDLNQT